MKQWGIERYKGFLITGTAKPTLQPDLTDIRRESFRPGRLSSIVEVNRIEGPIFKSKEEAEQHGLELCKGWIDKRR